MDCHLRYNVSAACVALTFLNRFNNIIVILVLANIQMKIQERVYDLSVYNQMTRQHIQLYCV